MLKHLALELCIGEWLIVEYIGKEDFFRHNLTTASFKEGRIATSLNKELTSSSSFKDLHAQSRKEFLLIAQPM